jgi:hypothetical protein
MNSNTEPRTLYGAIALRFARFHGIAVHKHADPIEGPRTLDDLDAVAEIVRQDPALIWVRCSAEVVPCDGLGLDDPRPAGWWSSATGDGLLDMTGDAVGDALVELLAASSDPDDHAEIRAGTIEILVPCVD